MYVSTAERTGIAAASARKSRASARVKFATLRIVRSHQRSAYGNSGMRSRWMAFTATVPPRLSARRASITTSPAGANVTAASSGAGGRSPAPPAHAAPSVRASSCPRAPRVTTNTSHPQWCATWIASRAEAPKP